MTNYDMDEIVRERERRKRQEESIKGTRPKKKPTGDPMITISPSIKVEVKLSDKDTLKLALLAHNNNVTLNAYCIDILRQGIESGEHRFEHDSRPQLLNEA